MRLLKFAIYSLLLLPSIAMAKVEILSNKGKAKQESLKSENLSILVGARLDSLSTNFGSRWATDDIDNYGIGVSFEVNYKYNNKHNYLFYRTIFSQGRSSSYQNIAGDEYSVSAELDARTYGLNYTVYKYDLNESEQFGAFLHFINIQLNFAYSDNNKNLANSSSNIINTRTTDQVFNLGIYLKKDKFDFSVLLNSDEYQYTKLAYKFTENIGLQLIYERYLANASANDFNFNYSSDSLMGQIRYTFN